MKKFIIFLWITSFNIGNAQVTERQLDSIVRHFHEGNLFHGSVLVARDGKLLLNKGYGYSDADFKLKNDPGTIFQIGSVTKQFTAVAILKLQEEGKLKVTDTISKYFPQLKFGSRITVHHLLNHTSGLYNYTNDTNFLLHESIKPSAPDQIIARFAEKPLDFEPGTKYNYSNSGYMLLGYLVEKVSGKKYEQYIRDLIFNPLGMNRSGFDFLRAKGRATGYLDNGTEHIKANIVDSTGSFAAGAIYSTTEDLYKWVKAIGAKKIMQPSSWEAALTPGKANYGYGWIIDKLYGARHIWHNGGIPGFVSSVEYFPDSSITIILLTNYMASNMSRLSNTLAAATLGKAYKLPAVRKEIFLPVAGLRQYEGTYELMPSFSIRIFLDGTNLQAQATGQEAAKIYPEKEAFFFYKIVDAQIEFEKDASGKVSALVLHQNGIKQRGKKIQ
jgi:CubicO group peptidase (beta-lactamase class C family)